MTIDPLREDICKQDSDLAVTHITGDVDRSSAESIAGLRQMVGRAAGLKVA